MASSKIIVKNSTLEILKLLKQKHEFLTYDLAINYLYENYNSSNKIDKLSNSKLLDEFKKLADRNLKRIEATHTRLGAFEKNYFYTISDIYNDLDKAIVNSEKQNNEELKPSKIANNNSSELEQTQKTDEDNKLAYKLNFLKSKVVEKDDVFVKNYVINLSESDYKKIFE